MKTVTLALFGTIFLVVFVAASAGYLLTFHKSHAVLCEIIVSRINAAKDSIGRELVLGDRKAAEMIFSDLKSSLSTIGVQNNFEFLPTQHKTENTGAGYYCQANPFYLNVKVPIFFSDRQMATISGRASYYSTASLLEIFGILSLSILGFAGFVCLRLLAAQKQSLEAEQDKRLAELAAQVAHDIRSPLAALQMATNDIAALPEECRILIRNAICRIQHIANSLLKMQKEMLEPSSKSASDFNATSPLFCTIESLVTEKRIQNQTKLNLSIHFQFSHTALFVKCPVNELKRVLSNLIDNSVEPPSFASRVHLEIESLDEDQIRIQVIDNGRGIPREILPTIGRKGVSFGKIGGSGLGLYYSKTAVEGWNGSLKIESDRPKMSTQLGSMQGTKISLFLPKASPPPWFLSEIRVKLTTPVVVLDDDPSIHMVWRRRFAQISEQFVLMLFSKPQELVSFTLSLKSQASGRPLFLVDYEILGTSETGLDFIEELDIAKDSILVTSRFEEKAIQLRCAKMGISIIPKNMAEWVPVSLSD